MAAPPIRGATAPVAGGSITSPSSTLVDDLVVVYTWERAGAGIPTHTLQSTFVQIFSQPHADGTTNGRLSVAYKVATASGAQSYQAFTTSTGSPGWWTGCVVIAAGTYDVTTRPPATDAAGVTGTGNQPPNPPLCPASGTFPSGDYQCFAIGAWHLSSSVTLTPTVPSTPATWISQGDVSGAATGDVSCVTLAQTAITSIDPGAFGDNQTPNGTSSITFVIAAPVEVRGSATPTLGDVTQVSTGAVEVKGSSAPTLGDVISASAGTVAVVGDAAPQLDPLTAAAAGAVAVVGQAGITLEALIPAVAGAVVVAGQAGKTLDNAALAFSGVVGDVPISGSLARMLDNAALVTLGIVEVRGQAGITLDGVSYDGTGAVGIAGQVIAALQDIGRAAAGVVGSVPSVESTHIFTTNFTSAETFRAPIARSISFTPAIITSETL